MSFSPASWTCDRLKDVAVINTSSLPANSDPDYEFDYLEISNVNYHGIVDPNAIERLRYKDAPSRARRRVAKNCTVISSVRPNLQAVAFLNNGRKDFVCSTGFNVVQPAESKVSPKFAYYTLISECARQYFEATAKGVGYPAVDDKDFGSFNVPLPPLAEQERIAAYLDASCAAIDAAVAAKRQQMKTLEALLKTTFHTAVTRGLGETPELRDSGYEWLGQLPVKWGLIAIKRIVSTQITDGPHETPELTDEGAQFVSAEAIKNGRIDFDQRRGFISWELHEQYCRKCKPQKGDIFVIKSGATTGNVAYVDVDFEFSIWSPLALIRCDERIAFYKFIYYVLLTDVFRKQVEFSWSFGTQQNIGMRVIERIKVPIPPVAEQREIAAYLDYETSKMSEIKSNIETQISTLTAYRKSLIHECVTGQRRITEADLNKVKAHG
jgi:type I restriction enzyme S subunit